MLFSPPYPRLDMDTFPSLCHILALFEHCCRDGYAFQPALTTTIFAAEYTHRGLASSTGVRQLPVFLAPKRHPSDGTPTNRMDSDMRTNLTATFQARTHRGKSYDFDPVSRIVLQEVCLSQPSKDHWLKAEWHS